MARHVETDVAGDVSMTAGVDVSVIEPYPHDWDDDHGQRGSPSSRPGDDDDGATKLGRIGWEALGQHASPEQLPLGQRIAPSSPPALPSPVGGQHVSHETTSIQLAQTPIPSRLASQWNSSTLTSLQLLRSTSNSASHVHSSTITTGGRGEITDELSSQVSVLRSLMGQPITPRRPVWDEDRAARERASAISRLRFPSYRLDACGVRAAACLTETTTHCARRDSSQRRDDVGVESAAAVRAWDALSETAVANAFAVSPARPWLLTAPRSRHNIVGETMFAYLDGGTRAHHLLERSTRSRIDEAEQREDDETKHMAHVQRYRSHRTTSQLAHHFYDVAVRHAAEARSANWARHVDGVGRSTGASGATDDSRAAHTPPSMADRARLRSGNPRAPTTVQFVDRFYTKRLDAQARTRLSDWRRWAEGGRPNSSATARIDRDRGAWREPPDADVAAFVERFYSRPLAHRKASRFQLMQRRGLVATQT